MSVGASALSCTQFAQAVLAVHAMPSVNITQRGMFTLSEG
jgi:hypothetical protein